MAGKIDRALRVARRARADGGAADDELAQRIADYERMRAEREMAPEDVRSMTHLPEKPRAPIAIEGGYIGKRQLGTAPYDVASGLSRLAQTAYDLKTLPLYAVAPQAAAASDIAEGVISGDPVQAGMSAIAPGRAVRAIAGPAVAAATMSPSEAQAAAKSKVVEQALKAVKREPLFDYSLLHEVPKVAQFDIPRYMPARGVPERVSDLLKSKGVFAKAAGIAEEGQKLGGANWYNTEPLRKEFVDLLGGQQGNEAFRKYMDLVAATSPRSEVGANVRNASYYYKRLMSGEGAPPVGERNPQPYGHMAQKLHQMNVQRVAGSGWDPLVNPKPASFVENLVGNQAPVTVDTHAFRLPAILAKDPRFLESAYQSSKDAPKQNIMKMVESGDISLKDALSMPAYWQSKPKENEYAAMEQFYKKVGRELGLSPAQTQASAWVGGGRLTGLASDESKPFIRFFEDRVQKTADETGMAPRDVLRAFIQGKMPLKATGGSVVDRALAVARGNYEDGGAPMRDEDVYGPANLEERRAISQDDGLSQRAADLVRETNVLARHADIDVRRLATLFRLASTNSMTQQQATKVAADVLNNDIGAWAQRFVEFPRSTRIISRVNTALGGNAYKLFGRAANSSGNMEPNVSAVGDAPASMYANGGGVDKKQPVARGGSGMYAEFLKYARQNYPAEQVARFERMAQGEPLKLMYAINQATKNGLISGDPAAQQKYQQELAALNKIARSFNVSPQRAFKNHPADSRAKKEIDQLIDATQSDPAQGFHNALVNLRNLVGGTVVR